MCLDTIQALDCQYPLKLTSITKKTKINCILLKDCLNFLAKQGLVENKTVGKERSVYVITQLGVTLLKEFRDLKETFPDVEARGNENQFTENCQMELPVHRKSKY